MIELVAATAEVETEPVHPVPMRDLYSAEAAHLRDELGFLLSLVEELEEQAGTLEKTAAVAGQAAWSMRKQITAHRARITILGEALPGMAPPNDA